VEEMPWLLRDIIKALPLTHTNHLLRYPAWNLESLGSLAILGGYGALCLVLAILIVRRYSE
jgi:ABC-type polysaccharide/polyol phosphate export permease